LRNPKDYEDFFAAARFSAKYRFEAAMMRFLPAALSFRLGFVGYGRFRLRLTVAPSKGTILAPHPC